MNINKDLTHKLLIESESFREFVVNKLFSDVDVIANNIRSFIRDNRENKIKCIKYVRDNFSASELTNAFPFFKFEVYRGITSSTDISLKNAKEFVELELSKL